MDVSKEASKEIIRLISGAYSIDLWDSLSDLCDVEGSLLAIYNILLFLHQKENARLALDFVKLLFDVTGMQIPAVYDTITENDDSCKELVVELLADLESLL